MGNITVYNEPNLGLQPTETGIEALTRAAYRGNALYGEAAAAQRQAGAEIGSGIAAAGTEAVRYESHREISAGSAHGAQLLANLTDDWNATAKGADPNDPSVAAKWREEKLAPALDQFKSGFNTEQSQQWAEHFTEQVRNHLFEKTTADMSSLAGVAVQNNVHNIANTYSNTAIGDPSAVPFLLDSVDHQIGGIVDSSPNLKGAAAAKVKLEVAQKTKEEIVKSGLYGAIQNAADPEAVVKDWVKRYPDYINGPEAETFARAATSQRKVNEYYTRAAANEQKQIAGLGADQARNKAWAENVTVDEDGTTHIAPGYFKAISQIPGQFQAAPGIADKIRTDLKQAHAIIKQQETGQKIVDDPYIVHGLRDLINGSDKTASELELAVHDAVGNEKLSTKTAGLMIQQIKAANTISDPMFKEVAKIASGRIAPKYTGVPLDADQQNRAVAFQLAFTHEYLRQQRAGTLQTNALNINDPKSLVSTLMESYMHAQPIAGAVTANGGVPAAPAPAKPAEPQAPAKGSVRTYKGVRYEFQGGDWQDQKNWKPAS